MLPRFEIAHRARPVSIVAAARSSGFAAPFAAIEADLPGEVPGRLALGFTGPDGLRLTGWYDGGRRLVGLDPTLPGEGRRVARSRRHGRPPTPPDGVAVALTGRHLSVLTRAGATWTVRGRVPVGDVDPGCLTADLAWRPRDPGATDPVCDWRSGTFGQLGLRDVRLVTHDDGRPVESGGRLFLTMTHAGPGFFDTGHAGVWSYDPSTCAIERRATLYFRRDGRVRGDHAIHLVRHAEGWLVAASTWGDFDGTTVGITLARSSADLLTGEHVLDATPVDLPLTAVGVWDPHLALVGGHWHLAFVAATKFFEFHPALVRAAEPGRLDGWELLGAAADRTATEGTTLARVDGCWRVLASDGSDGPPGTRNRFPVFDLELQEAGSLDAEHPGNIPWPTLLERDGSWSLLTFDGTPYGGALPGYGTHGDFVVLRTGNPS